VEFDCGFHLHDSGWYKMLAMKLNKDDHMSDCFAEDKEMTTKRKSVKEMT
jgi:hypothetical protein